MVIFPHATIRKRGTETHVCTGKFYRRGGADHRCSADHLHVDHHHPGSALLGESRSLQPDRPPTLSGHRTGHGACPALDSPEGDGHRFFTHHYPACDRLSPKLPREEPDGARLYAQVTAMADGYVKSPDAALRFIPRRCGVRQSTPHSSDFARLACGLFTKPFKIRELDHSLRGCHGCIIDTHS